MEALENLLTRRSVRSFTNEEIPPETITNLLKAAMQAPSSNNGQPWHFVVVDKREILDKISTFHPHSKMTLQAPAAIFVCAYVPQGKLYEMWIQDCAAASENILLAAHSLGLGGVWLGVHPREERVNGVVELLGLPEDIKPFSIIVLGYPAEAPRSVDRFNAEKVHYNGW